MDPERLTLPALRLKQWLPEWDEVDFSAPHRRKPEPYIYLCGLPAGTLRALSGINRRSTAQRAGAGVDLGIQRRHDQTRSNEIRDFVRFGLPWSGMSKRKRETEDLALLRKPGFLPTAIVINILTSEDERSGSQVAPSDLVTLSPTTGSGCEISLPAPQGEWVPQGAAPIEVIDGQHRLWAFSGDESYEDLELPVVAYFGLDIAWQAYLFYTINVKPKRINTSLAFDLYPLLRTEDWLERADALDVYRESRAQELTEALWRLPASPWHERIDMLGEHGRKMVSQAAWVRSLLASFVKSFDGPRVKIGGLFGAPVGQSKLALPWSRPQQAALLVVAWDRLRTAIAAGDFGWASAIRSESAQQSLDSIAPTESDPAFYGGTTLLNSDQGVRAYMQVVNDLVFLHADALNIAEWPDDSEAGQEPDDVAVERAITALEQIPLGTFVTELASVLATYDWRTASAPGLSQPEEEMKGRFRGSSGYRYLRNDLLRHIEAAQHDTLSSLAAEAREVLNLE